MSITDKTTISYYDEHADEYTEETLSTDLSGLIDRFLGYLPEKEECGTILDLGCGAGRDAKEMLSRGYDVKLADGSFEMCRIASKLTGLPVRQMLFSELDDIEEYGGIWSCAALLHVPKGELPDVLGRCRDALVPGGVLYASFKLGDKDGWRSGRHYSDMSPEEAARLFRSVTGFELLEVSVSEDLVEDRQAPRWVNVFARKV